MKGGLGVSDPFFKVRQYMMSKTLMRDLAKDE
jgi:hypothetical protein